MALYSVRFTINIVISLIVFFSLLLFSVSTLEFEVGGITGWIVPPANDTNFYNDWASEKRFQIGDTIRFNYRKDSIMEVNEGDYNNCNSTKPIFFANNGNTIFSLDRSGYFYFISGASGHCEKGQRMILKVLAQYPPGSRDTGSTSLGSKTGVSSFILPSFFQFIFWYFFPSYVF